MNIFLKKEEKKEAMKFKDKEVNNILIKNSNKKPKSLLFNLNKKNKKRNFGKDIKNIGLLSQENNSTIYFNNKKRKRDKSTENENTEISSNLNELIENKENIPNLNISLIDNRNVKQINSINRIKNSELKLKKINDKDNINNTSNINNNDLQIVKEYLPEIYKYVKSIENQSVITSNYITRLQPEINIKMRTILINWLIGVHYRFHLLDETLFICVKILDLYLSQKTIERKNLQLLGITSLFIAAKYEEIYPPKAKNLIYMTDNAFTKEEMLKMENDILKVLNFNVGFPTSLRFLEYYGNVLNLDKKNFYRVYYINELSLIDYNLIKFYPSLIACCCLYINLNINNMENKGYDEEKLYKITGYNYNDIKDCLYELMNILNKINEQNNEFVSIKKKYSLDKYMNVSNENYTIVNLV